MNRRLVAILPAAALAAGAALWSGCSAADAQKERDTTAAAAIAVAPVAAIERPVARFIRVTGTLNAEEQAEVAAETAGRVIATPVERGTPVASGAELIRLSPIETDAQLKEADANAAQIEARLGMTADGAFDVNAVPEVAEREGGVRPRAKRVRPHPVAARPARRLAVGVRPAEDADGSRAPAVPRPPGTRPRSSSSRSGPRRRGSRWRARRSPTRSCARRSPASSTSAWSRSATTSPRA